MTFHYSSPIESLIADAGAAATTSPLATARVLIVGSGYGGSVAAYRLSRSINKGGAARTHGILVLERGREYAPGEFPERWDELAGRLRVQSGTDGVDDGHGALFDLRIGKDVDVLVGSGLGGTSLINANVALRPDAAAFASAAWPAALRAEMAADAPGPADLPAAFTTMERLLGVVVPEAEVAGLAKHRAFRRTAGALGLEPVAAPVAVTFGAAGAAQVNAHGVYQPACTHCGNCISGCNVGAKNTLAMNLIPAAHAAGVGYCTGARVLSVQPGATGGPRWRVWLAPVSRETLAHAGGRFCIDADVVILAAGTLGSTEILQRSAATHALPLSARLGARFSTNGDFVAMSHGERTRVGAMGVADWSAPGDCGPTITALAQGNLPDALGGRRYTLEEGALPSALRRLLGEVLTTAAQAGRIARNRLPAWFDTHADADPVVVQDAALDHSQVFLVMSPDGAAGHLEFRDDALVPHWPAGSTAGIAALDARLGAHDRRAGLDGGQFVAVPTWRLLPAEAAGVMSGAAPGGRLMTVHPLGGCAMADSGATGVVDDRGRVFAGDGRAVHDGLLVLDGAIVPDALGVNPFLTIAALSWRACERLAAELPDSAPLPPPIPQPAPLPPRLLPREPVPPPNGRIVLREQLLGSLAATDDATRARLAARFPTSARWFDTDGLVLRVATEPADTAALLTGDAPVRLVATLHENPLPAELVRRRRCYGFPARELASAPVIATGHGSVEFLATDRPGALRRLWRTVRALLAFARRRGGGGRLFANGIVSTVRGFLQVAAMHADYRYFRYDLTLAADASPRVKIRIRGTKRVAWRNGNPRLWPALLELPVRFDVDAPALAVRGRLVVDLDYMLDEGLLAVAPDASVPEAVFNCFALLARFGRTLLQAGFWEFGAPDYPEAATVTTGRTRPPLPAPRPDPPAVLDGVHAEVHTLAVRRHLPADGGEDAARAAAVVPLVLTRYRGGGEPVLLVHGLAQGSLIYAHPELEPGMARWFLKRGYDVWLVDFRLSNRFDQNQVPFDGWTIDEIGAYDLPAAVHAIRRLRREQDPQDPARVHVFAHCVGAVGVAMAILDGRLTRDELASVALNAIHPWTIASPANRVRARLGVFFRDWLDDEFFDPLVPAKPLHGDVPAREVMLDRLAFSLARVGEQGAVHTRHDDAELSNAICDRMTFLYGRMWRHRNVGAIHDCWRDLVGRAPSSVQRHLFHMLSRGRVLDHEGRNRYLTDAGIGRWAGIRTLFLHGEESDVFNAHSAALSAYRLERALRAAGAAAPVVRLKRFPDYGHMDPILADDAEERCYPFLAQFFRGGFDHGNHAGGLQMDACGPDDDLADRSVETPETGPVLRGARIAGGRLQLRYWVEAPDVAVSGPGGVTPVRPAGVEPDCHWVDLDCAPDEYLPAELTFPAAAADGAAAEPGSFLATRSQPAARIAFGAGTAASQPFWLQRLVQRAAGEALGDCRFIVGSCHYPGTPFDRALAHRSFAAIAARLERAETAADALFLLGDQIYADATAGILDPVAWRDRYVQRYRDAFDADPVWRVQAALPVHFAVDDHEFADNYAGSAAAAPGGPHRPSHEDWRTAAIKGGRLGRAEFDFALRAARSYLGSAREARPFGPGVAGASGLWYALDDQELGCPAFVLDTRTEREAAAAGRPARLMSAAQLLALRAWLVAHRADPRPKFVFAGSVLLPLSAGARVRGGWLADDGLAAYPAETGAVLECIASERIERVVFVGGDLHLSCVVPFSITRAGHASVAALQIVASGLYAPLSFANVSKRSIDWDVAQSTTVGSCRIDCRPRLLTTATAHFVQVTARRDGVGWSVAAEAVDHNGVTLATVAAAL